ncbi:zinc metallopeptidase [Gorillibacterium massiliense]|uniref:zinc metallopeptidase n=1 Tax=Gorillibacterium massiliense TaxID=1280390 RepID=UPI0004B1A4ED|nr:zinc metallopeptidase [Gorillibacterium massiliense]
MYLGNDPMFLLILIAFGLSMWASFRVRGTFNRYAEVPAQSGMTGYDAARRMLDNNGLYDVQIEPIPGVLSDHYDPTKKVVRLSEAVYHERSISAISVACHEVGHAVQHKVHYPMLVLRHRMFPIVNFASGIAPFLLIVGIILSFSNLILLGIIFFSAAVAFQLVTLPVEFNATNRAKQQMVTYGFVSPQERQGVNKVLNAAALTYVAAALVSLLQLLRFVGIFNQRND